MVDESKGTCEVIVGGTTYDKMLSMNLRNSTQELVPSGTIVLSWPGAEHLNRSELILKEFVEGADGQIRLDGQTAATIRFDTRNSKGTPKSYELTLHFRGQQSDLVDSSVNHDTGQINNKQPKQILEELLEKSKSKAKLIDMTSGGGIAQVIKRFIVAEGETVERAMRRASHNYGLKIWGDENGNLVLSDGKNAELGGGELRLGHNFTQWTTQRSLSQRYKENDLLASSQPDDNKYGKQAEEIFGTASRVLAGGFGGNPGSTAARYFRGLVDGDQDKQSIEKKAQFDQNQRAGQGLNVQLKLSTWTDNSGKLWKLGRKYRVVIPVDEIDDELTIKEVEFELTPDSRNATITLENPAAGSDIAPDRQGRGITNPALQDPSPDPEPPPDPEQPPPDPEPPPPSEAPPPRPEQAYGPSVPESTRPRPEDVYGPRPPRPGGQSS